MGKIIKNGISYSTAGGSGSGDNIEIMTRAEYDALVEAGTVDADVVYFITDAGEGSGGNNVDLSELTDRVENLEQSFQDGCSVIASAITEKGVTTASNASPEVMAVNIGKITSDAHIIHLGGAGTYDIKQHCADYQSLTANNFICKSTTGSASTWTNKDSTLCYRGIVMQLISAPSVSYTASTGTLTVTAGSYRGQLWYNDYGASTSGDKARAERTATATITPDVYLVF